MNYKTFKVQVVNGVATVTFNYLPVNILGIEMMDDLNLLCSKLEVNKEIKVVIFESSVPDFFIAHADIDMLKNLSTKQVSYENIVVSDLARVLDRVNKLPQVTIAKIEGYARGGGHEFALACDMRFASIEKAVFMQMEVGMGILPCGGGSSRLAKIVGLGKALEVILSARDFNAIEAEKLGSINKAIPSDKISSYVNDLANRISQFPLESINACKKVIYASLDMMTSETLKYETYNLYQTTSQTPAVKRFKDASKMKFQDDLHNQKNFETLLLSLQQIK